MSERLRFVNMFDSEREHAIAQQVPEIEHAMTVAAHEPRAIDHVGLARPPAAASNFGYSAGSYSRSASCTITNRPRAWAKPVRSAAPLPRFVS